MNTFFIAIRSILFHLAVFIFTAIYSSISVWFVFYLPFEMRYKYLTIYSRAIIFLARIICGIKYQVEGLENLAKHKAFVALSKHQSQWETFFLANIISPVIIVCKKELLKTPMAIGRGIGSMRPITIDRSNPKQALKDITTQGTQRLLEDQLPVLMYPEGTRTSVGEKRKYARSGAALAITTGVPVVFISHNAGYFWPTGRYMKYPGTVHVKISEPFDAKGMTPKELTDTASEWIEKNIVAAQSH